ncbi:MAG: hypothetical protein LKI39_15545 [Bacteroides sp.]|jgi:hypothetical protein|nr:hypothetical protein [Bacteroides sp.]MCI1683947.1 hypothetical protein [Bacteroides sp.]
MKKTSLLLLLTLCILSCEEESHEETTSLVSTRAISGQSVTGEKNPYVGELYYTYTVDLGKTIDKNIEINISTLHNSALLRHSSSSAFQNQTIAFSVSKNTRTFTFDAYWIQEASDEMIFVTTSSSSQIQVNTNISGITVNRQAVTINAPDVINLGDKIELLAPYGKIDNNHRAKWEYDTNIFSKEIEDHNDARYRLVLKAKRGGVKSKISLGIEEVFLVSNWLNVRHGEHVVTVTNPFKVIIDSKYITQGSQFVVQMPDLGLAPKATVEWGSGEGISLVSGQGASKAVYKASDTKNGYSSIWANIADRGDTYLEKIDSIWIGKPIITSGAVEYIMQNRNDVIISPKIEGAQSVNWSLESGNATITVLNGSNGIRVHSKASLNQSDEIVVLLSASNGCGTVTQRYKIKVLTVARIEFTNINRSSTSISGRIMCDRKDIDVELYLDWALSDEGSTVLFKIQDKFYTHSGGGSEFVNIHLDDYNSFDIVFSGTDSNVSTAGIYITSMSGNGTTGTNSSLNF